MACTTSASPSLSVRFPGCWCRPCASLLLGTEIHPRPSTETPQEGGFLTLVPPTVFKELQVSVSVVEELDVVIGRGVGVLLFLLVPRDNNKVSAEARSQYIYTCINAGKEHLNTADFMFLQWKKNSPGIFFRFTSVNIDVVFICPYHKRTSRACAQTGSRQHKNLNNSNSR